MRPAPLGLAILSLAALAACGAPGPTSPPATEIAADEVSACSMRAERDWIVGAKTYAVIGSAEGPSCAEAVATLTIRAPEGRDIFMQQFRTMDVPLAFAPGGERLQTELAAWIENVAPAATADALPAWSDGAERPHAFHPALTREEYEAARAGRHALFCYPDGAESNACVGLDPNTDLARQLGSITPERP